jgi:two-component system sensor histidine kinase KdpD
LGIEQPTLKRIARVAGRYAAGLAIVVLVTQFYRYVNFSNETTVGFTYLLAILSASTLWGLRVSLLMSLAATLAYDYFFLPPINEFTISDPRDWVALSAFILTSVVGSSLSAWARREAQEAHRRRKEVETLYEFSQRLLRADDPIRLLQAIPRHVVEAFGVTAAALFLADHEEVYHWGVDPTQLLDAGVLESVRAVRGLQARAEQSVCVIPVRAEGREIGSVHMSLPGPSRVTLESAATLIEIAVERARAIERAGKMEAARESERLKSALLDAIAHDFRTPLTSIKGSVSGLLAGLEYDREQQRELLAVIDEECDRINQLVGEASDMARLDAGELKLDATPRPAGELISAVLADCGNLLAARPCLLETEHRNVQVLADLHLAKKVLVHLIENANLYSPPGRPISIHTAEENGFLFLSVADQGPGIEAAEAARIFDKFYRGAGQRDRVPGTGMGLAIAKAIVEAHGGTIGVVSHPGHGAVFTFSLPVVRAPEEQEACRTGVHPSNV